MAAVETTKITIELSEDIDLLESDVEVDFGNTGAQATGFVDNDDGTYDILIENVERQGRVTVTVTKAGKRIEPAYRSVTVYPPSSGGDGGGDGGDNVVRFVSLTADGSA